MKANKIYSVIAGLIVICSICAILFHNKKVLEEKAKQSLKENISIPVNVIKPQFSTNIEEVTVMGKIVSDNEVIIISKIGGYVIEKYRKSGDYVTKGTIIAKIEDEVISKKFQLANLNLLKAQKDVERYRTLLKVGAVTKMEVENVELSMRAAENIVVELKEQLKNTIIVSPITGFLERDYFEIGSFVSPGTIMAEIVDTKKIKVNATVTGKELISMRQSIPATILVDIYPTKIFEGKINSLGSKGNESMTYTMDINFTSDYSDLLKPGMHAQVKISKVDENNKILTIERKCIVGSLKNPNVYIIKNGKAYLKEIEVGRIINDYIEIVKGLKSDDIVVCNGQINLSNESTVTIY